VHGQDKGEAGADTRPTDDEQNEPQSEEDTPRSHPRSGQAEQRGVQRSLSGRVPRGFTERPREPGQAQRRILGLDQGKRLRGARIWGAPAPPDAGAALQSIAQGPGSAVRAWVWRLTLNRELLSLGLSPCST